MSSSKFLLNDPKITYRDISLIRNVLIHSESFKLNFDAVSVYKETTEFKQVKAALV